MAEQGIKEIKIDNTQYLIEPTIYTAVNQTSASATFTAALANFQLFDGALVAVKFKATNNANATLNINSTGAKPIYYNNAKITANQLKANHTYTLSYVQTLNSNNGGWELIGDLDTNTQSDYGNITTSGKIGTTADLAVYTTTSGLLTAGSLSVTDDTTIGDTATTFVAKVTQNGIGKITVTKAALPTASTDTAGITTVGASGGAAAYNHNHDINNLTNASSYLKWQTTTAESTALYDFGVYVNMNHANGSSMTGSNYFNILNIPYRKASGNAKADWGWQLGNITENDGRLWYRTIGNDEWGDWQTIAHATQSANDIGSATQPVYMTAAGVITAGTALGAAAYKEIINNTSAGALGWNNAGNTHADNLRLVNVNTLAYWDGTYRGTSSNLTYYKGGAFGTMAKETATDYAKLASPTFTGTPKAPTAANGTSTTQIATTEFVNNTLAYANAMTFKGTLGTGGTATTLPASHNAGDTYRVITAGTWAGKYCEAGTLIICVEDGTAANDAHWTSVETNEDGSVIGTTPTSSTDNAIVRWDGTSGRIIKNSEITIDDNNNIYTTGLLQTGRYFHNVAEFGTTGTPKEILIKTKIPFVNGTIMPKIYLHMDNYNPGKPTELSIIFYIYNGAFTNYAATSNTSHRPVITLSTYTESDTKYVAIGLGLIGTQDLPDAYYIHFNVDFLDIWSSNNTRTAPAVGWTVESNSSSTSIIPTTDRKTVSYVDRSQYALQAGITTTQYGISYYSNTTGTFASTAAGTSGQYLKSNGNSAPTWATFPTTWTPSSHTHGDITNDGKIGSIENYAVYTTTGGKLTAGSLAVTDSTASTNNTTKFVQAVTQDSKGQITVTKASLDTSGTWSGTATKATTTEDTTNTLYPVGVTSSATTTLKHDTSITIKSGAIEANKYKATHIAGEQREFEVVYGSTIDMAFMVGTSNANHGIYDYKKGSNGTWILSAGADNNWELNGNAATATTATTAAYIQGIDQGLNHIDIANTITSLGNGKIRYDYRIGKNSTGLFAHGTGSDTNAILTFSVASGANYMHQLGFSTNEHLYHRAFIGTAQTNDKSWNEILDSSNYTTYAVAKTDGVTAVTWDATNKKLTRTINGTAEDVMTAAQMSTALGLGTIASKAELDYVQFAKISSGISSNSTAAETKTYWANNTYIPKDSIKMVYNTAGTEYTLLFSNNNNRYGTVLKWGYADTYIRILRYNYSNGTETDKWYSADWEKISAGYADSAGSATTATTATNLSAAPTITQTGTSTIDLTAATTYTLTVGGKSIVFKTPTDNNNYVTQSASTTANWRKILLHYEDDTSPTTAITNSTAIVYSAVGVSVQPSTGIIRAGGYNIIDKVRLEYNTTDDSLDFVFI